MRACIDLTPMATSARFRGIGMAVMGMVRGLARVAHRWPEIELYALTAPGWTLPVASLHSALNDPAVIDPDFTLSDPLFYALRSTVAWTRLSAAGFDVYHSTVPKFSPRPLRCKSIVTCWDLIPVTLDYPYDPPILPRSTRALVERLRYRPVDHVIAISRYTSLELQRITGYPGRQVSVAYLGIEEQYSSEAQDGERERVASALRTDRPYFLYVGGFDPRKQVPALIEAFARACGELDEVLVIVGKTRDDERASLEATIERCGARGRVLLHGFADYEMLPAYYRCATAHTNFSRAEGFGMTFAEAMACGCPLVGLRASCIPEIVEDAALLVDPERGIDGITQGLLQIAGDADLRRRLRERGLRRAEHFTWDRCAEQTLEVYSRVAAS